MFPFYYDQRYEPGSSVFDSGQPDLEKVLRDIAREYLGKDIRKDQLDNLKGHLTDKGIISQNWGDDSFRKAVHKYLETLKLARKVARQCLT